MANSKAQYARSCLEKWDQWKKEGKEPKNRWNSLVTIQIALKKLGYTQIDAGKIKATIAKNVSLAQGEEERNRTLSFIVWDLTENSGQALDYSKDDNWFLGLMTQARAFMEVYTRFRARTKNGTKISLPAMLPASKGKPAQLITQVSKKRLQEYLQDLAQDSKRSIARLKAIGVEWKDIRKTVIGIFKEAAEMYGETVDLEKAS
jgi:hypothetical protein